MEQQILVPLDGSALAETVLPYAEAFARASRCALLLIHVAAPSEASHARAWLAAVPAALRHESRPTASHNYLASVAARLEAADLQVRTEILVDRDPAAAIVGRAERDPAIALIAIATHGRSGLSRLALGSVAARVLHAATKPLLLLRAREDQPAISHRRYRTILVPLDGSAFAERALKHSQAIAASPSSELVLVAVAPAVDDIGLAEAGIVPYWLEAECEAEREHLDLYLKQLAAQLTAARQHVHTCLVTGSPAQAILRAAEAERADLIVMTTHGRSGVSRLWQGSVAAAVAQGSQVPVLLIRR